MPAVEKSHFLFHKNTSKNIYEMNGKTDVWIYRIICLNKHEIISKQINQVEVTQNITINYVNTKCEIRLANYKK